MKIEVGETINLAPIKTDKDEQIRVLKDALMNVDLLLSRALNCAFAESVPPKLKSAREIIAKTGCEYKPDILRTDA